MHSKDNFYVNVIFFVALISSVFAQENVLQNMLLQFITFSRSVNSSYNH